MSPLCLGIIQLVDVDIVDGEKYISAGCDPFFQSGKEYSKISFSRFFTPVNKKVKMSKMFIKQSTNTVSTYQHIEFEIYFYSVSLL